MPRKLNRFLEGDGINTALDKLTLESKVIFLLLFIALYNLVALKLNPDNEFRVYAHNLISFDISLLEL